MPCVVFLVRLDFEAVAEVSDHLVEFFGVAESECVADVVGNAAVLSQNEDCFL